ncbi:hypothetical protein [Mobilicoccus massiliensis]|uniref:hypothetical protein n=1 Tax=Mobilicoccus massiliensis TaxID=1522310 RepID=UPI00058F65A0|nr:hypothetical protein [Mobilicoccus massiliensis]
MSISSRPRALIVTTTALAAVALLAPLTSTSAEAARRGQSGPAYKSDVVGTRSAPTPDSAYGTTSVGIASSGAVLATRIGGNAYLGQPARTRELASADALGAHGTWSLVLNPVGQAYSGSREGVLRWPSPAKVDIDRTITADGSYYGPSLGGVNSRGDVAGCDVSVKTGQPFIGRYGRQNMKLMNWPTGWGNCRAAGISERGVAAITQEHPSYRDDNLFPRAATMTTSGVRYLPAPKGVGTSADGISPTGTYIVGRSYTDGQPTGAVLWTNGRKFSPMRGAEAMTPKAVTDTGMVVGEENGRVVTWERGRKTDLTSVSKLPRNWVLTSVAGINGKGQIAVTATVGATNETVAMRLTPTKR